MYDFGNSAYATAVMAGFFPIFFKEYYSFGLEASESTFWLGLANSLASLFIFVLAPVLGAVSDAKNIKKKLLVFFAFVGILFTLSLYFVEKGEHLTATVFYLISLVGFMGGNLFYDSLLNTVAEKKDLDRISSIGYALGYLGGGILFLFSVITVQNFESFGLENIADAIKLSFILTALWWAVFTLPIIINLEEIKNENRKFYIFCELKSGFKTLISNKTIFTFLLAYWFYIDGVDTIMKMAVDFGLSIGLESSDMISALLLIQFIGFPATLLVAKIDSFFDTKNVILALIAIYISIVIWAFFMTERSEFFSIAVLIAFAQGGIQALSRSYYASIIPKEKSGEYFGFYNMIGKFASVLGPMLIGVTAIITKDNRTSILSIIVLFVIGGYLLTKLSRAKEYNL